MYLSVDINRKIFYILNIEGDELMNNQERISFYEEQQKVLRQAIAETKEKIVSDEDLHAFVYRKDANALRKLKTFPGDITFVRLAKIWKLIDEFNK